MAVDVALRLVAEPALGWARNGFAGGDYDRFAYEFGLLPGHAVITAWFRRGRSSASAAVGAGQLLGLPAA